MIIKQLENVVILRITSEEEALQWMPGVAAGYTRVFSGFPYFEQWFPPQAEEIFRGLVSTPGNITLLAATSDNVVAGFAAAIPLEHKKSVATELTGLVPIRHTMYLAELGVLPEFRGQKIGRTLVRERLNLIERDSYSHVVMRISCDNTPSGEMYKALGFTDVGVYMEVTSLRTDGETRKDKRQFLSRVLSQVDV